MRPRREPARNNQQTYFLTFVTAGRAPFFRNERWFFLLLNIIEKNLAEFELHGYVILHDHIHLLVTPAGALERTAQLIKGGFSFQAKRAFSWKGNIWQAGFSDHRIRDARDYEQHLRYIETNVATLSEGFRMQRDRHSSVSTLVLAPTPQRLKPLSSLDSDGGTEVPPFQNRVFSETQQNGL